MNYYLCNLKAFWTLSSSVFDFSNSFAHIFSLMPSGGLASWSHVNELQGVRPVINLKANAIISKGDGSPINPFIVKTE